MPKPLPMDLRKRLLRAVGSGISRHRAAEQFAANASRAIKPTQRYEAHGAVVPGKMDGHMRSALEPYYARFREFVAATPDITIDELRDQLAAEGIATRRLPLGRCLLALGLTRKKTRHAAE